MKAVKSMWSCKYLAITASGFAIGGADKMYLATRIAEAYQIKTGETVNVIKQDKAQK